MLPEDDAPEPFAEPDDVCAPAPEPWPEDFSAPPVLLEEPFEAAAGSLPRLSLR